MSGWTITFWRHFTNPHEASACTIQKIGGGKAGFSGKASAPPSAAASAASTTDRRNEPMSRKVYVKARVKTLVPVVSEIGLIVRADEDANIEKAVKAHLRGKDYGKADVEDDPGENLDIIEINNAEPPADDYTEPSEHLPYAVQELIEAGKATLLSLEITDSK